MANFIICKSALYDISLREKMMLNTDQTDHDLEFSAQQGPIHFITSV